MWSRCCVYLMVLGFSLASQPSLANSLVAQFERPQQNWRDFVLKPKALTELDAKRLQQDINLGLFIQEVVVQELSRIWTLSQKADFSSAQFRATHYNFSSMYNIPRQGRTPFAYFASTELAALHSEEIKLDVLVQAHANQGHGDTEEGISLNIPLKLGLSFEQLQQFGSLEQVEAWAKQQVRLAE